MLKTSLTVVTFTVLSVVAMQVNATPNYTNQALSSNFTLGANGSSYNAGTTLGGASIQNGTVLNLSTLPLTGGNYQTHSNTSISPAVASTIYRQNYSAVIGNTQQPSGTSGTAYPWIKDIVGEFTSYSSLPTTGTYTYNGQTVWHDIKAEGDFTYNINFATKKGSGSISNVYVSDLPLLGAAKLQANLNEANIVDLGGGRSGVSNGNVTNITTGNAAKNFALFGSTSALTGKYDLSIFGGNGTNKAQEVAGLVKDVTGGGWGNIEIGFAGKR